jgi:hypothetical protein
MARRAFPIDVANIIADFAIVPRLLPWIQYSLLWRERMRAIPEAFEAGYCSWDNFDPETLSGYGIILKNTCDRAVEDLRELMKTTHFMTGAWSNPAMIDILLDDDMHSLRIDWYYLSANPSKRACDLLLKNPDKISRAMVTKNPGMMKFIAQHPSLAQDNALCANPAAIEQVLARDDNAISWGYLCENPHPRALERLSKNQDKIHWDRLSANPGIFMRERDPKVIAELTGFFWE